MNFYQKVLNKIDWTVNTYLSKKYKDMKGVEILSFEESIAAITRNRSSLSRFGDGELSLMLNGEFLRHRNKPLRFQRADEKLKIRLLEVMNSKELEGYNLKLAVSSGILKNDINVFTDEAYSFWEIYLEELGYKIYKRLRKGYPYVDTLITRFYMDFRDKSNAVMQHKINQLQTLWDNENLLIVEGKGSRLGLNNDLFNNVSSIIRLICPNENAFDKYDEILAAAKKYGFNKTIVLALGPTATVLAYDLAKSGLRALDLGHIDIEYEWFLMGAKEKVGIKGKVMTEVQSDQNEKLLKTTDDVYFSQVVDIIP